MKRPISYYMSAPQKDGVSTEEKLKKFIMSVKSYLWEKEGVRYRNFEEEEARCLTEQFHAIYKRVGKEYFDKGIEKFCSINNVNSDILLKQIKKQIPIKWYIAKWIEEKRAQFIKWINS